MSPANAEILDLVARMDDAEKEIERLGTLEFGTVAFPIGGAGDFLCHETKQLIIATDFVEFTAIPQTHRHMLIVHEVASTLIVGGFNIHEMNFNGDFAGNYDYFWRQQFAVAANINYDAAGAAILQVGSVPARDSGAGASNYFTSGHIWIPNYASIATDVFHPVVWDNFSREGDDAGVVGNRTRELGGGHWLSTANITIVRFTCSGPQFFRAESRWTLILMCTLP